jgi:hypothetical protein
LLLHRYKRRGDNEPADRSTSKKTDETDSYSNKTLLLIITMVIFNKLTMLAITMMVLSSELNMEQISECFNA